MHSVLDDVLVAAVLLASVVYAAYSLGPKALRRRLLQGASTVLRKLPSALHLQSTAQRLEESSLKAGGSCGGCDNCESTKPASGSESSGAAAASGSPSEIRVPLSAIRRR
jgi:hypothetical protein